MMSHQHILVWGDTPLAAWLAKGFPASQTTWLTTAPLQSIWQAQLACTIVTDMTAAKKPDLIVLAMPAWQVATALQTLQTFVPYEQTPPPMVSLQWGIGALDQIQTIFPNGQVLSALWTNDVQWGNDQNAIRVGDTGHWLVESDHAQTSLFIELVQSTGETVLEADGDSLRWSSVLWSMRTQAMCAIMDCTPSEIYASPELFDYEYRQLAEAIGIMDRLGVQLIAIDDVNLPLLVRGLRLIPQRFAHYWLRRFKPAPQLLRNELKQDTMRSSAAYINGAIAVAADKIGLETPINYALALTVTDIAEGRALWSQYQGNSALLKATLRLAIR